MCALGLALASLAVALVPGMASAAEGVPGVPAASDGPESPLVLVDPTGLALGLESLEVRLASHGPLALTELDMVFRNPLEREIEGRFTCVLPVRATVSRFAKEVDGRLMEGEVVERLKATRIYTQILHTLRDPALLQQDQGNRFQARIFPIPAGGTVRLLMSWSEVVPAGPDGIRHVVVPLRGLPRIGRFGFRAVARPFPGDEVRLASWLGALGQGEDPGDALLVRRDERRDFMPPEDASLEIRAGPGEARRLAAGDFEMLVVPVPAATTSGGHQAPAGFGFWFDTSASYAQSGEHRIRAFGELLRALGVRFPGVPVTVEAFDAIPEALAAGPAGEDLATRIEQGLRDRELLGATDLAALFRRIGEAARAAVAPRSWVVVSDLVPTLGTRVPAELVAALGEWPAGHRLSVLVIGSTVEAELARAVTDRTEGRVVTLPLTTGFRRHAATALDELLREPGLRARLEASGAGWVQPAEFRDLRPGSELVAFLARTQGAEPAVTVEFEAGASAPTLPARPDQEPGFAPLLEREAYRAYLQVLEDREAKATDVDARTALRAERIEVSVKRRVLCPLTALLVLETEEDYRRFGIDRRALADILVVGEKGIELLRRAGSGEEAATPPETRREEEPKTEKNGDAAPKPSYPPGRDPRIRIRPPPGTVRVVAVFPWGEVKTLEHRAEAGIFETRFVVPRGTVHGYYEVVLVLTGLDGAKTRMAVGFHADRRAPRGSAQAASTRIASGWKVRLAVTATSDAERVEAVLPWGKACLLVQREGTSRWEAEFEVPGDHGPLLAIPVSVLDRGHNRLSLEVEVELP